MVISVFTLDMNTGRNTKVSKSVSWTIIPSKQGSPCYMPIAYDIVLMKVYLLVLLS